jgi:hypothetical protein
MRPLTRQALLIGMIVVGIWLFQSTRPVRQPPGILAPDPPSVTSVGEKPAIFERNGHVLTALAGFRAKARAVSIERYARDREARIAPLDIVLGWGRLSDVTTFQGVEVAQTQRQVVFKSYDPKVPDAEVEASMVNLHLVGADSEIERRLAELRPGNIVEIEGWLVEAVSGDGWRWKGEARAKSPLLPGTLLWVRSLEAS